MFQVLRSKKVEKTINVRNKEDKVDDSFYEEGMAMKQPPDAIRSLFFFFSFSFLFPSF